METLELHRRTLLKGLAGVACVGLWPACRLKDRKPTSPGWLARLPPDRVAALGAATEAILPGARAAGALLFIDYWMQQEMVENMAHMLDIGAIMLNRVAQVEHQAVFAECSIEQQAHVLGIFQKNAVDETLAKVRRGPAKASRFDARGFFERLVTLTLESYLGEPKYGGNKDKVGWHFIGWKHCWWSPKHIGTLIDADPRLPY